MKKDQFKIPMPDESTIEAQISQIVSRGLVKRESFSSYLRSMVQQVGWRHLFSDRLELSFILSIAIGLYSLFLIVPNHAEIQDLYTYIFLFSPILFLALSIYTYVNKTQNATYDVEMACKYNVYQVIAFRMLAFSISTMFLNTLGIAFLAMKYEGIHFIRAFMLSSTSLLLFSIILLFALMNRRTKGIVMITIAVWVMGNTFLKSVNNELYNDMLLHMPVIVYAVVLLGCLIIFMNYLKKLIVFKQSEGVF
ncbi:hypothetical protein MHZ92_10670 [Sporosarcina sp. ACRSL]|uniref:hypothetical protein n=1 Tax=Sporosarcina sp. ACRSL TaxID=2918215 RepID=UPI001EF5BA77|nr:hypothetical protein [Sporosarcina sp. ACRSL]MCG7344601.1 hypothetical protein [Sporosarcina sp. ACRSL]